MYPFHLHLVCIKSVLSAFLLIHIRDGPTKNGFCKSARPMTIADTPHISSKTIMEPSVEQKPCQNSCRMTSLGDTVMFQGAFIGRAVPHTSLTPSISHSRPGRCAMDQQRVISSQQASTSGDSSRNLSSRGKSSTRAWQHQWRYMRSERARTDQNLPKIDWTRYHLQVNAWASPPSRSSWVFHSGRIVLMRHQV